MKRTSILIALLCILFTHNNAEAGKKRRARVNKAHMQIRELHDGVLIVKLKTYESTIGAIRKAGYVDKANEKLSLMRENNIAIIQSFEKEFKFCEVHFFLTGELNNKSNKDFSNIVFVDDKLNPIGKINFDNKKIFSAEFADSEEDSTGVPFNSLLIRDNQLQTLQKPFPGSVIDYYGTNAVSEKHLSATIAKLNKNLFYFYSKRN